MWTVANIKAIGATNHVVSKCDLTIDLTNRTLVMPVKLSWTLSLDIRQVPVLDDVLRSIPCLLSVYCRDISPLCKESVGVDGCNL